MELILWRHAEAEDSIPDMARELTSKGQKQARHMAAWLKPRLPEGTRILVSPARRTQQTAAALGVDFSTLEALAPDTTAEAVLAAAGWPNHSQSALIVGHQPTLGEVASIILESAIPSMSIKKGAVWWFSARRGDPQDIALKAMISPDMLQD
ncbi:histidine phosphatase family protein [Methylobacillus sp. MM3]|jgi:phosphohistidine phosphatase|uniref:SixA phosphatase family protein n=1 Tax=Methylobacillus sp. MM3 TaxID=1848039 RepID=UPI0007E0AC37|nr:histidine phosphatase family protein [Methylobacillus sp. MM3]OAJ72020.1 histidine phosphatase family protein [Methylobacillus sp. MM3]